MNRRQPKQYFIMIIQPLARHNKLEKLNLFPKYMSNISNIGERIMIILIFLKEDKNSEIVQ